MVSQLQPGMTRDQVRFVLGTPLLTDIFHDNRWDYVYRRQRANSREVEERRLSVFFENDRLVRVEGDVTSGLGAAAASGKAPGEKQ
jgi:outer membrane protein assembly factor BamE